MVGVVVEVEVGVEVGVEVEVVVVVGIMSTTDQPPSFHKAQSELHKRIAAIAPLDEPDHKLFDVLDQVRWAEGPGALRQILEDIAPLDEPQSEIWDIYHDVRDILDQQAQP